MKPELNKNQGWKNILLFIIPYFIIAGTIGYSGFLIAGLKLNVYASATTKQSFIITFFELTGTLLTIFLFLKYVNKKSFLSLGFTKLFYKKDIYLGIVVGFLVMFLGFIFLLLLKQIDFLDFNYKPIDIILSIGIFIFVAITEETLCRGFIQGNLMISFNKYFALIISSLLFSLMHAGNDHINLIGFINLFIAGVLLGLPYMLTRNLWFPIALHFSWNFFQGSIFGFNVSGRDFYSLITIKENTATIWNGGLFGFEGSILAILFQIITIGIVFIIFKSRSSKDLLTQKKIQPGILTSIIQAEEKEIVL